MQFARKSAIMMLNSIGLRTQPRGTPLYNFLSGDRLWSTRIAMLLSVRKFLIHLNMAPDIFSLEIL